jgi:ATP-dependent DNA ligase
VVFLHACKTGLEGIVSKRLPSIGLMPSGRER